MLVASTYGEVWRSSAPYQDDYSEYSSTPEDLVEMIYERMPMHITPFRPGHSNSSTEDWQETKIQGNVRKNFVIRLGDEIRTSDGRRFVVDSVESTDGIFMRNQRVLFMHEVNPIGL